MTAGEVVRVAMWSGPRNISTAMMRAWENRPDTVVVDEPLYAALPAARPGSTTRPATRSSPRSRPTSTGWSTTCARRCPTGRTVHYAKHMTQHLAPGQDLDWIRDFRNVLLVRDPARGRVVLRQVPRGVRAGGHRPAPAARPARPARVPGEPPPVIDAADFLRDPEAHLRWLCDWLGIPFTDRMLAWPAGPRDSDGVWAPHWYDAVWASTGFAPYRPREVDLSPHDAAVAEACRPAYERLRALRLVLPAQ